MMLAARETWSKNPTGVGEGWLQVDEVIKKIPGAEKTCWITLSFECTVYQFILIYLGILVSSIYVHSGLN